MKCVNVNYKQQQELSHSPKTLNKQFAYVHTRKSVWLFWFFFSAAICLDFIFISTYFFSLASLLRVCWEKSGKMKDHFALKRGECSIIWLLSCEMYALNGSARSYGKNTKLRFVSLKKSVRPCCVCMKHFKSMLLIESPFLSRRKSGRVREKKEKIEEKIGENTQRSTFRRHLAQTAILLTIHPASQPVRLAFVWSDRQKNHISIPFDSKKKYGKCNIPSEYELETNIPNYVIDIFNKHPH